MMAKNKTTVRFWLRTDRLNSNGTAPIHLIYQVQGNRRYYAVPEWLILPINWDDTNQVAVYISNQKSKKIEDSLILTSTQVKELNEDLDNLQTDLKAVENSFRERGKSISAADVIDTLKVLKGKITRKEEPSKLVFDFIDRYIFNNTASRVKGSLSVYKALKMHLAAYQSENHKMVAFDKINYAFFQSFQNFLIGRKKIVAGHTVPMLNNTTIAKQLSTLKTFLNYAKIQGVEISDNYKQFKIKRESMEVIALTNQEFEALLNLDLKKSNRLAQVRDVFCFSCATGLRYSDLEQLRREHIKNNELIITIKKTRERLRIPLNKYSGSILAKYISQQKPLPVISNQKMNTYLKELCKEAGINEPIEIVRFRGTVREAITYPKYELIGVHTGRKTFVTLSLEKGMAAEDIMKISGHKDYASFKRYVNITEERKKVVMKMAWGENLQKVKLKAI